MNEAGKSLIDGFSCFEVDCFGVDVVLLGNFSRIPQNAHHSTSPKEVANTKPSASASFPRTLLINNSVENASILRFSITPPRADTLTTHEQGSAAHG
jgi:hypothetical protein